MKTSMKIVALQSLREHDVMSGAWWTMSTNWSILFGNVRVITTGDVYWSFSFERLACQISYLILLAL